MSLLQCKVEGTGCSSILFCFVSTIKKKLQKNWQFSKIINLTKNKYQLDGNEPILLASCFLASKLNGLNRLIFFFCWTLSSTPNQLSTRITPKTANRIDCITTMGDIQIIVAEKKIFYLFFNISFFKNTVNSISVARTHICQIYTQNKISNLFDVIELELPTSQFSRKFSLTLILQFIKMNRNKQVA